MKHLRKSLLTFVALVTVASLNAQKCCTHCKPNPCFTPRSQATNAVRELVGWEDLIHRCNPEENYHAFALALEYSQSFRENDIARCLFGDDIRCSDCSSNLGISGSCVKDRNCRDWLADYFCLPSDYQSCISFCPEIKNFVADLQFYCGFKECCAKNVYFRLNLPITHTRWSLNCCESVIESGSNAHPAGYFCCDSVPRSDLNDRALQFFCGSNCPKVLCEDSDTPVTVQNLCACKWNCDCCPLSLTALADVEAVLGWNFVCEEDHYVGLNFRVSAPTGTKKCCPIMFAPIAGNGGFWEAGVGLNLYTELWRSDEGDRWCSLYIDANITHLFETCQLRCFDLCCKPNSRYMLAQKLTDQLRNNLEGEVSGPDIHSELQFANEFAPVANITNSQVNVSVPVQGDIVIKFEHGNDRGWRWDIGYNLWARSCEKICRVCSECCDDPLDGKTWALKGDAHVFGFESSDCVALAATQSKATIHSGTNRPPLDNPCTGSTAGANNNIDNPLLAEDGSNNLFVEESAFSTRINTSIQPITISACDLDLWGSRSITHKVFAHMSYTWEDKYDDYVPFLGVGASAEFAQDSCRDKCCNDCCNNNGNNNGGCCNFCNQDCPKTGSSSNCSISNGGCCDDLCCKPRCCTTCGLSQWSVWLKGGFTWN